MRFSEFKEAREINELRNAQENGSGEKSSDPVTEKLGLIKTMSPEALALKLRKEVKNERIQRDPGNQNPGKNFIRSCGESRK